MAQDRGFLGRWLSHLLHNRHLARGVSTVGFLIVGHWSFAQKSKAIVGYSEKVLQSYAISYEDFVPRTDSRENLRGTDDRLMTDR